MTPYNENSQNLTSLGSWLKRNEKEQIAITNKYGQELENINGLLLVTEYGLYKLIYCIPGTENTEMIQATTADLIISVILYLNKKYG